MLRAEKRFLKCMLRISLSVMMLILNRLQELRQVSQVQTLKTYLMRLLFLQQKQESIFLHRPKLIRQWLRLASVKRRRAELFRKKKSVLQHITNQVMRFYSMFFLMLDRFTLFQLFQQEQVQQVILCLCLVRMKCSLQKAKCYRRLWLTLVDV